MKTDLLNYYSDGKAHGRYLNGYLSPQQIIEAES